MFAAKNGSAKENFILSFASLQKTNEIENLPHQGHGSLYLHVRLSSWPARGSYKTTDVNSIPAILNFRLGARGRELYRW